MRLWRGSGSRKIEEKPAVNGTNARKGKFVSVQSEG